MIKPEEIALPEDIDEMKITPTIFKLQLEFMKELEKRKKIPNLSEFNLANKGSQVFMRDNLSCLVEEMMEMHEIFETLCDAERDEYLKIVKESTRDFNVEQSDTLHFWVEAFILLDWGPTDIKSYFQLLGEEKGVPFKQDEDPLVMSLQFAEYHQNADPTVPLHIYRRNSFTLGTERLLWPDKDMFEGGTLIGSDLFKQSEKYLFKVTYYIYLAMGLMKGKYWREEEIPANKEKIIEYMMEAWIWYNLYLSLHGFTAGGMIKTYYRKNQLNFIRQQHGW